MGEGCLGVLELLLQVHKLSGALGFGCALDLNPETFRLKKVSGAALGSVVCGTWNPCVWDLWRWFQGGGGWAIYIYIYIYIYRYRYRYLCVCVSMRMRMHMCLYRIGDVELRASDLRLQTLRLEARLLWFRV